VFIPINMSAPLKIGIVEDDMVIADALCEMLVSIGYQVTEPAMRYAEAIDMIEREKPDLLLLDITLIGKMDGIDIAFAVQKNFHLPFIFLTANMDASTIERAKAVQPLAYLAKPITKEQLYSAIEIAFSNFNTRKPHEEAVKPHSEVVQDSVFVKDGYAFRRILFADILFMESDANYVSIHLSDGKKVMTRNKLDDFILQLDGKMFIRVHRSFAVNRKRIEGVFPTELIIGAMKIPIGKTYRDDLLRNLGIEG
jgi:DNA-binding LytR/AlgR family response regulator